MAEVFTCGKCPNTWTGHNRAHCSNCCITFGGVASFDRHRQAGTKIGRKCAPPESLGLKDNGKGVWVAEYGVAGDDGNTDAD
jgi:hypothetical protein